MNNDREPLLLEIKISIDEINQTNFQKDSLEQYLLNHLNLYLNNVEEGSWMALLRAADKFSMFCTEHMNWDTEQYKKYVQLAEHGRKIAKREKTSKPTNREASSRSFQIKKALSSE